MLNSIIFYGPSCTSPGSRCASWTRTCPSRCRRRTILREINLKQDNEYIVWIYPTERMTWSFLLPGWEVVPKHIVCTQNQQSRCYPQLRRMTGEPPPKISCQKYGLFKAWLTISFPGVGRLNSPPSFHMLNGKTLSRGTWTAGRGGVVAKDARSGPKCFHWLRSWQCSNEDVIEH